MFLKKHRPLLTTSRFLVCILVFLVCISVLHPQLMAEESDDNQNQNLDEKKRKIEVLQSKLREVESQKVSLSSTIQLISTKISLSQAEIDKTQAEISKLEKEIANLGTRIGGLEQSLDVLSVSLVDHVSSQYKEQQIDPIQTLLLSKNLTQLYETVKYLKISQEKTREIIVQSENQKHLFDEQKTTKEEIQKQVEAKKQDLAQQKNQLNFERSGQQKLLEETKNDEAKYQAELQKTLAEVQAIQGIIAGQGNEVKVTEVKEGDRIASIIVGASPCSNGTHLHFEVVKDGAHQDPAGYLSSVSAVWNNSPDSSFSFNGGWAWPINNPARINQGYGMTYYARVRRAYGGAPHTGIDMISKDSGDYVVKAVKEGTLFRGGIGCGGRTLQYVRVIHKDNPAMSTYYLHVNY